MKLVYFLFCLGGVYTLPAGYNPEEAVRTEFELTLYDLQDDFDKQAEATKEAYLKHHFEGKGLLEKELGNTLKDTKKLMTSFSDIPEDIYAKWLLLNRPGDFAMAENDWNTLIDFSNSLEKLREGVNSSCNSKNSSNCVGSKQEIVDTLATSKNLTTLRSKWSSWQSVLAENQNEFAAVLQLVKNASEANEQYNVNSYWEMLADYDNGFSVSEGLWNEVKPLYDKLHSFVRKRLYTYYNYSEDNLNETGPFPVFMSGSLLGDDWSNIADIILPHPYLLYDAKSFLHTKSSKHLFQHAETVITKMGLPRLTHKFWSSSTFDHPTCPNLLLTYCEDKHSEVLTCSSTSWKQYLDVHELVMRATLRDMEYDVYPLPELRGSAFDEAVVGLTSFFAVNAMDRTGVVNRRSVNDEKNVYQKEQTQLLLMALRVLPKLAFYFAVDKWRLMELEAPSENLGRSWEIVRQDIQGLQGLDKEQYDFLSDEYITSNKPYLSKFLGVFLQYQIIEYFKNYIYNEGDTVFDIVTEDTTLSNVVKERLQSHWRDPISINFGINEILAQPLLDYFRPLEEYLDDNNVPIKFISAPPFTTEPPTTPTTESLKRSAFTTEKSHTTTTDTAEDKVNVTTVGSTIKTGKQAELPKQNAGMYVGLAILACVAVLVVGVLVRNRLRAKRRSNNNRRFET